jgi:hypothetical protein
MFTVNIQTAQFTLKFMLVISNTPSPLVEPKPTATDFHHWFVSKWPLAVEVHITAGLRYKPTVKVQITITTGHFHYQFI